MIQHHGMITALSPILVLIATSALATDRLQTQHWIDGTPSNPLATPAGGFVYETNPILAGRPYMLDPYFDFWEAVVEAAPRMLSPPLALAVVGWIAFEDGRTVIRNNELSRQQGFPEYVMLKYRWRF